LQNLEQVASSLCAETVTGYVSSIVNLIRIEEGTIEAIAGIGEAAVAVGRVRHPIHPSLAWMRQDVQADIVLSGRAELVLPDDPRLDEFVKEQYGHVWPRFFIPLVIVNDAAGAEINRKCRWVFDGEKSLRLETPDGAVVRVFGTLEVGIEDQERGLADFERLANLAAQRAPDLYRCTLASVLDTIVRVVRGLLQAPSVTLHLGKGGAQRVRWYADYRFHSDTKRGMCWLSRSDCSEGSIGGTPRPNGLGMQALAAKEPRTKLGADLQRDNPTIRALGYYAMTAFPMFADGEVGLVFVHTLEGSQPENSEMPWIRFVVQRAASCIRVAKAYAAERDRSCQLLGQMKTAYALAGETRKSEHARERLANGSMLALSAADVSLLFKVENGKCALFVHAAGIQHLPENRSSLSVFAQAIVRSRRPCFVSFAELRESLQAANGDLAKGLALAQNYLNEEYARSLVVLPLCRGTEVRFVLVLMYRRELELELAEQEHLLLVASNVARSLGLTGTQVPRGDLLDQLIQVKTLQRQIADQPRVCTAWSP
jgi:hypothetical protein